MPHRHPIAPTAPLPDEGLQPIIRLWLLRMLLSLGGYKKWLQPDSFSCDQLAQTLGLGHWLDENERAFDPQAVRLELRQLHQQAERDAACTRVPDCLRDNTARLAALVGLSAVDCRILEFACCIHAEQVLKDTADLLGEMSSTRVCASLAVLLELPLEQVRAALAPQSVLARTCLVVLDRNNGWGVLRSRLDLLARSFADEMCSGSADLLQLLRGKVCAASPGQLQLTDYPHLQGQLDIALPYLQQASAARQRGVNLYIHGAPGTGKSELARTLARHLGCELFEVATEDEKGDAFHPHSRLRAFRAAQSFFAQRQALLVFDEAEDVFNDGTAPFGNKSTAHQHKGWVNRMLEDNPVPTLWLSNSNGLDAAFIRRFDMVFELPVPPRQQRLHIVQQHCHGLLAAPTMARLSEAQQLAPAVVARAAQVVRSIDGALDSSAREQALERLVNNTLQAQGHAPIRRHDPARLPELYDPNFLNADSDLSAIAQGIAHNRSARLCLYGPPGTGKTAYGRWLAQTLEMPLLVKRASDLQSKWVGECEKNMARAFHEAEQEGALLLIDEVDSFLQDRRDAQRSWEVSQVNEMLTQMEAFAGVFIASTNLMQGLDQAALRRFDLKVRLDYLRPPQAWALLQSHCAHLGLQAPSAGEQARLARLQQLTPGDFAAVLRQSRFKPLASAADWLAALESECALKEGSKQVIGFV